MERKLLDECVHCGFCLPACPTYQSWGEEMDSPRGRIYLMRALLDQKLELTPGLASHFDQCLGCMGCVTACPSGVKYDALIEQTRAELETRLQRTWTDRLFRGFVFALFPYPRRLRWSLLLQLAYEKLGLRRAVRSLGLARLLPRRLRALEALMPPVSPRLLRGVLAFVSPAVGMRRARVALLAGCVQRVYFPQVNAATLRVLNAEGVEVVVPPELGCCGALSVHAGREAEARERAKAAIAAFEHSGCETLVVNAAGCGSSMKQWGRLLRDDPAWASRASAAAAKVKDISELLASLPARAERHPLALRAAYHDACHLAHGQRIRLQPRALLAGVPQLEVSEIPDGDQCCGSAGIYNLLEPDSAREIGARKVENLLSVAPQLLVSANPGCTLHLSALLRERGVQLKTAHPIEVLDASIRGIRL